MDEVVEEKSRMTREELQALLADTVNLLNIYIAERNEALARRVELSGPMTVLRALFGHDICTGDVIHLDGDEEPSGRVGFSLIGADGETKRCGITGCVVMVEAFEPEEEDDE